MEDEFPTKAYDQPRRSFVGFEKLKRYSKGSSLISHCLVALEWLILARLLSLTERDVEAADFLLTRLRSNVPQKVHSLDFRQH